MYIISKELCNSKTPKVLLRFAKLNLLLFQKLMANYFFMLLFIVEGKLFVYVENIT